MPEGVPCKYGDLSCTCQDGDMCHYEGPNPMTPPIQVENDHGFVNRSHWRAAHQISALMKPTGVNAPMKKG